MSTPVRRPNATEPARAKITTISTRSSPSVPPASLAYEPFVKSVLSQRLLNRIFLCSAAFTLLATTFWRSWSGNGGALGFLTDVVKPQTLLYASFLWFSGVLPVLIARKVYLKGALRTDHGGIHRLDIESVPYVHTSSPKSVLATTMPTFRGGLYIYMATALAFTIFHILSTNATAQNGLRLFVKSKCVNLLSCPTISCFSTTPPENIHTT